MSVPLEGISIQITFAIDPETFHKLQKLAEREETGVSDIVREVVNDFIAAQETVSR